VTEERVFRPTRGFWALGAASFLIFAAMAALSFAVRVPPWMRLVLVALAVLGVVGLVELRFERLELRADELAWVQNFRRRSLRRAQIESVTWQKGAGVSVQLAGGRWVALPGLGHDSRGLTNTIRAWINRGAQ